MGFNVAVGGGMGVTHGNKKTYPRLGDVIGFCKVEEGPIVAEKVMLVQRDHGNRVEWVCFHSVLTFMCLLCDSRKNARLKYTVDRMGLDVFKLEVEKLLGYSLQPARPYAFDRNVDDFGWVTGQNGKHHFTLFIENGRVQDEPGKDFKTGLKEIAKIHKGTFRLTANQHIVITDVASRDLLVIKELLAKYKLDNLSQTGLRLSSSACVAFPTCGESPRLAERLVYLLDIMQVWRWLSLSGCVPLNLVLRMT